MVKSIFKGVLISVILTLVCVLIFALVLQFANISDGVITPVTQVIKVACIFIGVMFTLKKVSKQGWLYGGLIGILYTIFSFLIFAIIDGNFVVGISAFNDLLFATVTGIISAFILRLRGKGVSV